MRWCFLDTVPYSEAEALQMKFAEEVLNGEDDSLLLLEHPPIITIGAKDGSKNIISTTEAINRDGLEIYKCGRGGDVTIHSPGMLIIYPIFNLKKHGKDILKFIRNLEQIVIAVCKKNSIEANLNPPNTGCWVQDRKIASVGIKVSKWISLHGIALYCNNNTELFKHINPCGIPGCKITTMSEETGVNINPTDIIPSVVKEFENRFCKKT